MPDLEHRAHVAARGLSRARALQQDARGLGHVDAEARGVLDAARLHQALGAHHGVDQLLHEAPVAGRVEARQAAPLALDAAVAVTLAGELERQRGQAPQLLGLGRREEGADALAREACLLGAAGERAVGGEEQGHQSGQRGQGGSHRKLRLMQRRI